MFELNNAAVKLSREMKGLLIGVGVSVNLIGGGLIFYLPISISLRTNGGIVLRYLGLISGTGLAGLSIAVGAKLEQLKPLTFAADKVEKDLSIQQLAHGQLLQQKKIEASTNQALELLFRQTEPRKANPNPNPNPNPPNPIYEEVRQTEPTEPNPPNPDRTQTEPEPEPVEIEVEVEVDPESYFNKEILHSSDIYEEEVKTFIHLYKNISTSKKELAKIMYGDDIKKGSSRDWIRASGKLNLIAKYAQIDTGWG